jgi:hypothetical protein
LDIDGWLRGIGPPQYAELFRANDIDGELLGRLTNDDLKDIGVASFGHRKEAIAELGGKLTAPSVILAPIPATTATAPISVSVEAAGERRYLTVMFCDLVGSTGIAAQLDAEEWRDIVGGYLDAASAAVTEMGGHVAKKLRDGILALFGYPIAEENDAERAARAALAIQRALAELNRKNAGTGKPELAARIGLDTGPAVVDAAGEIYGDVANVAARRLRAAVQSFSAWLFPRHGRLPDGHWDSRLVGRIIFAGDRGSGPPIHNLHLEFWGRTLWFAWRKIGEACTPARGSTPPR